MTARYNNGGLFRFRIAKTVVPHGNTRPRLEVETDVRITETCISMLQRTARSVPGIHEIKRSLLTGAEFCIILDEDADQGSVSKRFAAALRQREYTQLDREIYLADLTEAFTQRIKAAEATHGRASMDIDYM